MVTQSTSFKAADFSATSFSNRAFSAFNSFVTAFSTFSLSAINCLTSSKSFTADKKLSSVINALAAVAASPTSRNTLMSPITNLAFNLLACGVAPLAIANAASSGILLPLRLNVSRRIVNRLSVAIFAASGNNTPLPSKPLLAFT